MTNVREIKFNHKISTEMIEQLNDIIARIESGETRALAVVEIMKYGRVGTVYAGDEDSYHYLNSGCATLAARVALGD